MYRNTTKPLISNVIQGFNATVFAYGATGAGKTYTMLGTLARPGIMGLTFEGLFSQMETQARDKDFKITMSYLEIYNECIKDLLSPSGEYLDLREDPQKGVTVAGINEVIAKSA